MGEIEEYNKEPVFYCKHCLSLKIKMVPNMEELVDVSVDIGHSDKVVHLFGEIDGIRK